LAGITPDLYCEYALYASLNFNGCQLHEHRYVEIAFSLVLAVLYFTVLGTFAVFLMWPVAIIVGLVFVKMHNDQMRQSGSRLLLGPGEEGDLVSTMGSWGRGFAVLSLLAVGGYLSYWYLGDVDKSRSTTDLAASSLEGSSFESSVPDTDTPLATTVVESSAEVEWIEETVETSNVISFEDGGVTPVIIDSSSSAPSVDFTPSAVVSSTVLIVDAQLVNLREGPGTNYSVVDKVEHGTELQELDRAGTWVNVTAINSGVTGWIYGGLLSER